MTFAKQTYFLTVPRMKKIIMYVVIYWGIFQKVAAKTFTFCSCFCMWQKETKLFVKEYTSCQSSIHRVIQFINITSKLRQIRVLTQGSSSRLFSNLWYQIKSKLDNDNPKSCSHESRFLDWIKLSQIPKISHTITQILFM